LKRGSAGPTVAELQDILRMWGHDPGRSDGRFGPRTEAALKGLQAGLARFGGGPADGIYGPRTAAAYVVFLNGLTRAA
jgi:peptidoglycan hydrolase-like protein with peptidoglycan-binding domain